MTGSGVVATNGLRPASVAALRLQVACLLLASTAASVCGQDTSPRLSTTRAADVQASLDRFVREGMERLGIPGLSLSGVTAAGVVIERGWGVRDVEHGGAVDSETGFYIASATKSFVGVLATLLDDRGWIELDAPLSACLPGLDLAGIVDPRSVTLRDHLTHARGWANNRVNFRTAYTDFLDPPELRGVLARTSYAADTSFDYNNIGYIVADLCFREHLGIDWKELVETQVLVPAGLTQTTPFMSEAAGTGNLALPHVWDGTRHRRIPHKIDAIMHAAGGLVTSAADAGRWIRIHLGNGSIDGRRIFPPDVIREVLTRQVDGERAFPVAFTREGYGIGWFDGFYGDERLVSHFGGYPGAQAHISMMPERDLGVAAFVNGGGGSAYALPHLAAALFYDLMSGRTDAEARAFERLDALEREGLEGLVAQRESSVRRERLRTDASAVADPGRYTGVYRAPTLADQIVTVTPAGGLWIDMGAMEGPLVREDDHWIALWATRSSETVTFDLPTDGPARSLTRDGREARRVVFQPPGAG